MKKLITSIIIVLPLIILMILLVSGAIMSLSVHIYVESVELTSDSTIYLVMDDEENPPTYDLGAEVTVLPLKATNRNLNFKSDNQEVATVDANGKITAVYFGETYITISSKENTYATASRKVVVTDDKVHKLEILSNYNSNMYEDESQTLSVYVYPKEAENQYITWSCSNYSALQVNQNGRITAVGAGVAKVTATSVENPKISASVEITCYPRLKEIQFDSESVLTSKKSEIFPELNIKPNNFGMTTEYRSDDDEVATVDDLGNITFHKPGHVKITARVTDYANNFLEVNKEYTSTYGYYLGPLFTEKNYTVNYDEYSHGEELPIYIATAPEGAYQLIQRVTYTTDGVLNFNEETKRFYFVGQMPKGVTFVDVTVHATVYDAVNYKLNESHVDTFRLNVNRDATEISTSYNGIETTNIQTSKKQITFSNDDKRPSLSTINVEIGPENHTNRIEYQLETTDVASLDNGVLTFNKSGSIKVSVVLYKADNTVNISKEIDISYTSLANNEKEINVGMDDSAINVTLNMSDADTQDTGIIYFTTPQDTSVEYNLVSGIGVVELVQQSETGNYKISPLKGGEANIQIVLHYLNAEAETTKIWDINVYVDYHVTEDDFAIAFNGQSTKTFRTSKDFVNYSVAVSNVNGCMEGKDLFIVYDGHEYQIENFESFSNKIDFAEKTDLNITFEVRYKKEFDEKYSLSDGLGLCVVPRTISTTHGNLDDYPVVTYEEGRLVPEQENKLTFKDLHDKIVLTIDENFTPQDFDITQNIPTLVSTPYVDVVILNNTITLTSKDSCKSDTMYLTIGGKTFTLVIESISKADTINVSFDNEELNDTDSYTTIADELFFDVDISRKDGKNISNNTVEYSFDNNSWQEVVIENYKVKVAINDDVERIYFRSADEGVSTCIKLSKIKLDDFQLKISTTSQIAFFDSVKDLKEEFISLPGNTQGNVTLSIIIDNTLLLGGVGNEDTFKNNFELDLNTTGWASNYDAANVEITIVFGEIEGSFNKYVTLKYNTISLKLNFSFVQIQSIEFEGFDNKNIYLGNQQVRLFAKNSYYKNAIVNYFKMPFSALESVAPQKKSASNDDITWTLSRWVGNTETQIITTQKGRKVTYLGNEYKIDETTNALLTLDGKTPGNIKDIIWIDTYFETGIARIYFGNFAGLRETDVQNDYFGNFGDSSTWTQPQEVVDDKSGRNFDISAENSFAFLRVNAGDGTSGDGSVNCHFNFNVLDDTSLVNVFNATGYYNNSKIVLHNNLYGPGELDAVGEETAEQKAKRESAVQNDLFINSATVGQLNKTLVYGNGNQINLQALNTALCTSLGDSENTGNSSLTFNTLYNVTLKGTNPADSVSCKTHKILLKIGGAYYCNLQYYSKMNPISGADEDKIFFKNTVLRYVANCALQLFTDGKSTSRRRDAYFENVVIAECLRAISLENGKNNHLYFKGFFDVLNYNNSADLQSSFKAINGGNIYASFIVEEGIMSVKNAAKDYVEWFGKNATKATQEYRYYVNMIITETGGPATFYRWENDQYLQDENKNNLSKSTLSFFGLGFDFYSYNVSNTTDGGASSFTNRTMSELFTDSRYIRLLCEYKTINGTILVKNVDHIQWHMQRVYRDPSLAGETTDHIEHLKESLKNSDGSYSPWPDGSSASDAISPMANKTLKFVLLPNKEEYV